MNKDLEQAKALLENNEEYTCAACRAGESFASEEHGVRPLMRSRHRGDRGHGRAGHPQPHGHGLLPDGERGMGHLRSARGQGGAGTENFRDDGKEIDTFTC